MPETKQRDRVLAVTTVKGEDTFLIDGIVVNEALSELFTIEIDFLYEIDKMKAKSAAEPEFFDPRTLLGTAVNISAQQSDDQTVRYYHGILTRFEQGAIAGEFTEFSATLRPQHWLLTQRHQSRIFQQKSVPDILKVVFEGLNVEWKLGSYPKRDYCVQYRESDFDFASRLMEEEGIWYRFRHEDGKHTMVVADKMDATVPTEPETIPFITDVGTEEGSVNAILSFDFNYHLGSGKVTLWDHNFELHSKKLEADKQTKYPIPGKEKLEVYDHPGGYAKWFTGVDAGGGDQAGDLNKIFDENKRVAELEMQRIDCEFAEFKASSMSAALSAGSRFKLDKHPWADANRQYVVTAVTHTVTQSPGYRSGTETDTPFNNDFSCIPFGKHPRTGDIAPVFRPQCDTPKPTVMGSQTAYVVGPSGEEIFTDKHGRVKVQFHWDRQGKNDAASSCWVRVAQSWAGKKWGTMFIPRIGSEVIVDFIDGDPDRPIITGCVYNPVNDVPYKLPDNKTRSTIKTSSSPGGSGFNELRFEDKKGKEQIYVHAERDFDDFVKNDRRELIGGKNHLEVQKEHYEKLHKDKHLTVGGDHNEKIGGTMSLTVGMNSHEKVGMNYAMESGMSVHVKAGMTMVLEAGVQLSLKVGGNFIDINPAGIFIQGTMVMINSGGAAGSGQGASPTTPELPEKAESGESGQKNEKSKSPPPPPSDKLKEAAKVAKKVQPRQKSPLAAAVEAAMKQMEEQKAKQDAEMQAYIESGKNIATQVAKGLVAAANEMPFVN